ncbi:EAL domain-containing protein [Teredinibacter turnerae]|uniref:two-component system response regulator n=1 Tax=Teredinibacter turnerae TaxID=2426 RepID=UPI00036A8BE8|nr:EAL domain-containing protein [Teredinibacter turnerae]
MINVEGIKILVAYQDPHKLHDLTDQLQRGGIIQVTPARSAAQALNLLKAGGFDLLLCGIDLPDIDGWRMARLIRSGALGGNTQLPIVVVTEVWCQRIAEVTAREYGVNRLIPESQLHKIVPVIEECLDGAVIPYGKPRLLVIEDAPDTADLIRRVLDRQFAIEVANDGEHGLRLWREGRHRLILLDYMLPQMSGKDILAHILKEDPTQPVVMMTAHSSPELAEQMMMSGVTDFLPKPFRTEALRKVCELAIRRDDFLTSNREFAEKVESLQRSESDFRHISETHQLLLDNLQTVVMELDSDFRIRFLNVPWRGLTGYDLDASLGCKLTQFVFDDDDSYGVGLEAKLQEVFSGARELAELELCLLDSRGQKLWAQVKIRRSENFNTASLTVCLDNITKRKEAQRQLEYLAMHDSLTGLFNRHYFEESLRQSFADAIRNQRHHGLIYIDLDYFKVINDTFGHHEGDEVLRQVAHLMKRRIRAADLLCRLGGDEYAVLVHDVCGKKLFEIARELQAIVNDFVYQAKNHRVNLGCSIGLSVIDGEAVCAEEYLMQADIALYVAKGRGRNLIHLYDPEDQESEELRSRINWTQRMRKAISEDRIVLHFQPVFDAHNKNIVYYEALVRMRDEEGNLVYPNQFIPALENTGEMHLLDRWIVKLAIRSVRECKKIERVAINLSAQAFKDENLVPVVKEALALNDVAPECVTFELTESASLFNLAITRNMITQLNEIGCTFAIDDFGSGFSSFAYLKELPAHFIKLDGSFIKNLHQDDVDKALVRSLIQVVQALGKKAVAEFVENEQILEILRRFGVDCVQGYHTGRPVTFESLMDECLDKNMMA